MNFLSGTGSCFKLMIFVSSERSYQDFTELLFTSKLFFEKNLFYVTVFAYVVLREKHNAKQIAISIFFGTLIFILLLIE